MYSGIALIIGILIGAIIVYLLMQSKLQRSERLLQQSREQLSQREQELHHNREQFSHLEQAHRTKLRDEKHQLQERYEQLFAEKVERYQDNFEQKIESLEAEYEARMLVLGGFEDFETGDSEAADVRGANMGEPEPGSVNVVNTASAEPGQSVNTPLGPDPDDLPEGGDDFSVKAVMASTATVAALPVIPDPWDDSPAATAKAASDELTREPSTHPNPSAPESPKATAVPSRSSVGQSTQPDVENRRNAAIALGKAAATSPKQSLMALPQLAKLSKDSDPAVRLAAIQALGKTGSIKAIPLLRQALRDVNSSVVAAATEGLNRFKGLKTQPTKTKSPQKKLPKNR